MVGCSDFGTEQPASTGGAEVQFFERGSFPKHLSDWQLLTLEDDQFVPNDRVIPYDLKSALFTDYALKFRTVYVPEGAEAGSEVSNGSFDLPIGSILTKTFFYAESATGLIKAASAKYSDKGLRLDNVRLIETRLLVHTLSGWIGLPYVWNEDGTEAELEVTGQQLELSFADSAQDFVYSVPDFNQCQGCHVENLTAGVMSPIGFKSHHIDKSYDKLHEASNQLEYFQQLGYLKPSPAGSGIEMVNWQDENQSVEDRARSYLDINCAHCHNPNGAADTSGMFLTRNTAMPLRLGVCKPPVAAGQGTGGRPVGISPGEPERSILSYRMGSLDLGAMMPELGRSLVHTEGLELIDAWIEKLTGDC